MYLKSIELSGFKSFAKKSELVFTTPISAIVGPNGSGKSNVAEAFRFVLGEQSIKSLRGKKGEDLIFNGAGSEPRANRAAVKLVFNNADRIFGIDFSEVVIERVVHRDGVNDYFINSSPVRLKDVVELLLKAHIGASGHHIISQGEADKILNASPKERKSIIEDALGLRLYQYKRLESERKLKKTFENIAHVESLRKEIAPHLKFLKKQVEKVEKAASLKEDLVTKAREYFKRENLFVGFSKVALKDEREPLEQSLKKLSAELEEAKQTLEKAGKESHRQFAILELEADISQIRAQKDGLSRELGKVEGSISAEERVIKREQDLALSEEHKMVRLREVEDLAKEIEEESKKTETTLQYILERIFGFIKKHKAESHSELIHETKVSIEKLQEEKKRLELELKEVAEREHELQKKYEEERSLIEREKDSSRDAEKAVFRIMAEENDLISKLSLINSKEESLQKDEAELLRDIEEIAHLAGPSALHFQTLDIGDEVHAVSEDRQLQKERQHEIEKLKIRLEDAGISGTDEVVKEYKDASERDEFFSRELLDLDKSAQSLRELIKELEERLTTEFSSGIKRINGEFGGLFSTMFGGGDARLVLTRDKKKKVEALLDGEEVLEEENEEGDVVEEGLDIEISLPRKKIKGLMMLSGGERALTSIALLFAISQVNPPPFIILDETDAALDEANSKRYGDMVEKLSAHSQLILITHNRETMSRAGVIYGVTMSGTGVSKLLSIEFDQAISVAK
jgi:chromosome segregation protein